MEIITSGIIIASVDKPFCLFLGFHSIESNESGDIELQTDTHFVETLIVFVVHIAVSFGMGKKHIVALVLDAFEDVPEIHGGIVVARFNKQLVAVVSNGQ